MRRKLEVFDCHGLATTAVDDLVTKQVLRALEPAALELSLKAIENVQRERQCLNRHWEQRLERASYDVRRAERQYKAVELENRLVVRSLEQQWEAALRAERNLREEYDRFLNEQAPWLTEEERSRILPVSAGTPALWHASETTARDRKEIIRLLIERIVIDVHANSKRAEVTITWRGSRDRQVGFAVRVSGRIRPNDGSDREVAPGRPDDQRVGGAARSREIPHAKNSKGLYANFGASALVSPRTNCGRNRPRTARERRMVVA
jgi:hypothetical protein